MKKQLLITGIFFLFFVNLQAQEDQDFNKNKTTFGIKGGLSYSLLHDPNNIDVYNYDFYGGFFLETRLSKDWSIQSELNYSETIGYSFIEIPLLLKYHINKKWSVFAGPQIDISANSRFANTEFERIGVSLVLGTQYNFSKNFFLDGRINYGLTKQIDTSFGQNFSSFSRRIFRIGIGYKF